MDNLRQAPSTYIYALRDPRTNAVRYVGKSDRPRERYGKHCQCRAKNLHLNRWIEQLLLASLQPVLEILEECSLERWQARERYWEEHFRAAGEPLTNLRGCGDGPVFRISTPELRQKLSAAHKKRLEEHPEELQRLAEMRERSRTDPEIRARISASRSKVSKEMWARPEYRAKMAEARARLRENPDYYSRWTQGRRGRTMPQEQKAQQAEWKRNQIRQWRAAGKEPVWSVKTWEGFLDPSGTPVTITNLKDFCRENGLGYNGMWELYHGVVRHHRGWTCIRAEAVAAWNNRSLKGSSRMTEAALEREARKWQG